jgi:hypothetical protein
MDKMEKCWFIKIRRKDNARSQSKRSEEYQDDVQIIAEVKTDSML